MKHSFAALLLTGLPLLACAFAGKDPADYRTRWPLVVPEGASLVRLPLPAEVLTTLQTANASDMRIFNAQGQPVPMSLDRSNALAEPPPPITLPALPIHGDTPAKANTAVSLRINQGTDRVLQLQVPPAQAASETPANDDPVQGFLLDARTVRSPLAALDLDAHWPEGRTLTLRLQASTDLRQWKTLGETTVYRHGSFSTPARIALPGTSLYGHYLHLDWQGLSPGQTVQVQRARLLPAAETAPRQPTPARLPVPLTLPPSAAARAEAAPHVLEFSLPFATPLAALNVRMSGPNTVLPLRVLARNQRGQPWKLLAQHLAFTLTDKGQARHSGPIELGSASWPEWRIEADAASIGFVAKPQITALLTPAQVVFVTSGNGPYTLAAGRPQAVQEGESAYLDLASLIPGYAPGKQHDLPTASLGQPQTETPAAASLPSGGVAAHPISSSTPGGQQMMLWAVLAAGVLALALMAWRLIRRVDGASANTPSTH